MKHIINYFSEKFLPRWLVLLFDLSVVVISWGAALLLRFNFDFISVEEFFNPLHATILFPVYFFFFWKSKSYSGVLRRSTTNDIMRIFFAMVYAGIVLAIVAGIGRILNIELLSIPFSILTIHALLVTTFLVMSRLFAKMIFKRWIKIGKDAKNVMIFGAGQLGHTTLNALILDHSENYRVIGFIDDNFSLHNKYVSGIPIYSVNTAFNKVIPDNNVKEVIFAVDNSKITRKRKSEIADKCLNIQLQIKEVPPVQTWINGELQAKSIRPIKIEDLLGRNSIQLDRSKIEQGLKDSVVLVTGAAGSIGSEIVRQLIDFNVRKVILLDKAESDLYDLQQEIIRKKEKTNFEVIVGDVTNKTRMRNIFEKHSPTIVFNAAAYKHVPLMEEFPYEAVRVNIGGTKIVADLAVEFNVEKFVLISTDKAVNPTNVMGATKRISEMYVQALAQSGKVSTQFITTRFGNVLGSNGSVVPLFKKQIEKGGPITITHKDITRYFMTIPEACQLVLEAGFMGKGSEIFVFDMGEPVKIYDLAKKMISLSGFVPEKDIQIKIVGLRPGEKLFEELLSNKEILQPTHNEKIMIGKDRKHDLEFLEKKIGILLEGIDYIESIQLVDQIRNIVPEFVSMNSYYSNKNAEELTPKGQQNYIKRKTKEHEFALKNEGKSNKEKKILSVE